MTGKTHKVFGICTQPFGGAQAVDQDDFTSEDTQIRAHVFGAIFDIDENGATVDFTAIDFDGQRIRDHVNNTYGMSTEQKQESCPHFARVDKAIFIPITDETAELLLGTLEHIRSELKAGKNDFYLSRDAKPRAVLERSNRSPLDYAGQPRSAEGIDQYRRQSYDRPRIATNCMEFLQNTLEKIGGVPINDITVDGLSMPRNARVRDLRQFIDDVVGNADRPWGKKLDGRMVDLGEGRKAYFYDSQNGEIDVKVGLNGFKSIGEAPDTTIANTLLQATPLYDASLNGYELSTTPAVSAAR